MALREVEKTVPLLGYISIHIHPDVDRNSQNRSSKILSETRYEIFTSPLIFSSQRSLVTTIWPDIFYHQGHFQRFHHLSRQSIHPPITFLTPKTQGPNQLTCLLLYHWNILWSFQTYMPSSIFSVWLALQGTFIQTTQKTTFLPSAWRRW